MVETKIDARTFARLCLNYANELSRLEADFSRGVLRDYEFAMGVSELSCKLEQAASSEYGYQDRDEQIKSLLDEVATVIRYSSFRPEHQEEASVAECIGKAISKYFTWDSRIFIAFVEALEDANFHAEASIVQYILVNLRS